MDALKSAAYSRGMERSRAEPEALKLAPPSRTERPAIPAGSFAASVLALQRAAGNQATAEFVRELKRREEQRSHRSNLPSVRILDQLRVQRATVSSWAGDWKMLNYKTTKDGAGNPIGVGIDLDFNPGDNVNATGIGIVQGVVSTDKGVPLAINKEIGDRSLTKGAMKGFHIDQLTGFINPLYATTAGTAGEELGTTPTNAGWGRHGWRIVDRKGKEDKLSAQLHDAPTLPAHGANAKQVFETTAMAFSGRQAGTYYGSVRWGWKTNAAGKFSRLPFSLLSNDVPTGTFVSAAALWNKTKTAAGTAHIRLGVAFGRWTNHDDSQIVGNPAKAVDTEVAKIVKNTRVEVTSLGTGEKFNKDKDKWWKVTIIEGPQIGLVGWTLAGNLDEKKVP
jgi:hypothetical protein